MIKNLLAIALCGVAVQAAPIILNNASFADGLDGWSVWEGVQGVYPISPVQLTDQSPYDNSGLAMPYYSGVWQTVTLESGAHTSYSIDGACKDGTVRVWIGTPQTQWTFVGYFQAAGYQGWRKDTIGFSVLTPGEYQLWFQNYNETVAYFDISPIHTAPPIPEPISAELMLGLAALITTWRKR